MTEGLSASDVALLQGRNNDGMFGDNNAWWIILFLIWGNRGGYGFGGGSGASDNYVLASDFATLQRQLSDGFSGVEKGIDTIRNGLCDGFYTEAQLINGVNMNIAQNGYESRLATQQIGSQLASCCCDIREGISGVNYNMATQANGISREIERGFCDVNYGMATNTTAIMQNSHNDTDRILAKLDSMEMARKDEKIADLQASNFDLRLSASQAKQNAYLIDQLGYHCPVSAYVVQPPQQVTFPTSCCGVASYGNNYGCGNIN